MFQIFAALLCDLLWFSRNKAFHEGVIPDIDVLAKSIKKYFSSTYCSLEISFSFG
jgi:hypothetical protein